MESSCDVIIVGGGIIGLACAHYLIEKNISVKIIEQEAVGAGASHGNCGLLYFPDIIPVYIGYFYYQLHKIPVIQLTFDIFRAIGKCNLT